MANPTTKIGFKRVANKLGYHGRVHPYYVNNGYATAVYVGDAVVRVAAGSNDTEINTADGVHPIGSLPEVELAAGTDGSQTTGVIVSILPLAGNSLQANNGVASTHRVVLVADDPYELFEIRDDGAAAIGITAVGLNALFQVGTPDSTRLTSGAMLDTDGTAPSADASNPLTIVDVASVPSGTNDPTLASTLWVVRFNNHTEATGSLGI